MKKLLSTILVSTMVLSVISTDILATESMEKPDVLQEIHTETLSSGTCGDNATWSFDSATGTLTISGTGDMYGYESASGKGIDAPWYSLEEEIRSIVVNEGITNIGARAFAYFDQVSHVTLPSTITRLEEEAFSNCTGLISINLPEGLTYVGSYALIRCRQLQSISIPDTVSYIGAGAFQYLQSIISLVLPSNVTELPYNSTGFAKSVVTVSIPASITTIDDFCFSSYDALETVYYGGSEEDRANMSISSSYNAALNSATWFYNYQEPTWTVLPQEPEDTTPSTPLPVATLYTSYLTNISGSAITSGSLPSGLGMLSNGTLGGIPTQQGDFDFYIGESRYSLHIQENTSENVETGNDFEIIERVPTVTDNFEEYVFEVSGEFPNFMNFYLDGKLLIRDVDYYAEEGSTRITLYAWTIGQLPIGMHTINATFTYGSGNNIEVQKVSQSFSKTSNAAAPSDYADYVSPTISGNSDTASYVAMNFSDVSVSDWFYTQVEYMYKTKTFSGTTATTYSPNDTMTRAMMAVVLYAFAEKPETTSSNISDVALDDWYGNAVHWMGNQNIVTNSGNFRPNDPITREETAVMMYNFCESQNISLPSVSSSEPKDFSSISESGKIAVETLFQQGIFGGDENGNFNPSKTATRAEISTIMKNFMVFSA